MPLYDTTADVIRKALRGLDMAPADAARRAGLPEREVMAASRGPVDGSILSNLAPALGLDGEALAGLPDYQPPPCPVAAVRQLEMPFDDETVNAWLVEDGAGGHLLFDTGVSRDGVRQALEELGIERVDVLITHSHHDHTGGLPGLRGIAISVAGAEGESLEHGDQISRGKLKIRVIELPGHCHGALGYVVEGLDLPCCVTGDALFAGSMGGCGPGHPYRSALSALQQNMKSLPPDTIILPGHGPASNVGSERRHNPFVSTPA